MMRDDVCRQYLESGLQIKVTEVDGAIVMDGNGRALLFGSKLFAAQSEATTDCLGMSPLGAGRSWFASGSTKGVYTRQVE
jgi:hypothetical protein